MEATNHNNGTCGFNTNRNHRYFLITLELQISQKIDPLYPGCVGILSLTFSRQSHCLGGMCGPRGWDGCTASCLMPLKPSEQKRFTDSSHLLPKGETGSFVSPPRPPRPMLMPPCQQCSTDQPACLLPAGGNSAPCWAPWHQWWGVKFPPM